MTRKQVALLWVISNALAATLFVGVASLSWIEPELADIPGASGGQAVVWFMTAVPVLALAVLANLGVVVWACIAKYRRNSWPSDAFAWASVAIWFAAVLLDGSRHGA